ncbi:hypothetical protein HMH01_01685 [Halovulum dunhuangense]|uniref:Uncharacterized protein n=1 Tax=Halovulum dunhuangense TaxID=1505036 RepID=A0A849KUW9_9RHOB|nr:hypothetical protein [Halovulum dunhuangense]NNU79138.1 hypothetical protein [Halovulum dunhuangense]
MSDRQMRQGKQILRHRDDYRAETGMQQFWEILSDLRFAPAEGLEWLLDRADRSTEPRR